jgi:hypothetical protein
VKPSKVEQCDHPDCEPEPDFAAVFDRDGRGWYWDGTLVGMGDTPGMAVDDLRDLARHLVVRGGGAYGILRDEGGNQISLEDRRWLFSMLDDESDAMYEAMFDAMRFAEMIADF